MSKICDSQNSGRVFKKASGTNAHVQILSDKRTGLFRCDLPQATQSQNQNFDILKLSSLLDHCSVLGILLDENKGGWSFLKF